MPVKTRVNCLVVFFFLVLDSHSFNFSRIVVTVVSENDPTLDTPFTSLATLKRGSSFGVSHALHVEKLKKIRDDCDEKNKNLSTR